MMSHTDAELDAAYDQLKAKLVRASENADRGGFFTQEQVRREIDELRRARRPENT
ncbi:MAG TPA: hypothetical protein VGI81_01250 [Tepidisphaeraceae bacterium]|jgi:hypothetical protein